MSITDLKSIPAHLPDRFWDKVKMGWPGECWEWQAAIDQNGYGKWNQFMAHRVAYTQCVGPIGEGLVLDHLCRNRACVNPWHLEEVTQRTNILRGEHAVAVNARKTHCPQGHTYEEHAYIDTGGRRRCGICRPTTHKTGHQRTWTSCINGHELTEENTYVPPGTKKRKCRACRQRRKREWRERQRSND